MIGSIFFFFVGLLWMSLDLAWPGFAGLGFVYCGARRENNGAKSQENDTLVRAEGVGCSRFSGFFVFRYPAEGTNAF